jgi:outer membrane protein OmpA-like peptidoglycan-associated protein
MRHKSAAADGEPCLTLEGRMKRSWALAAALLISACAEQPRQAYYAPPPPPQAVAPRAQPHTAPQAAIRPRSPAQLKVPQSVPSAGPLRTAAIGSYMDNQERDLREHVRPLGVGVARPGDQLVLSLLEEKVFDGNGAEFTANGKNALTAISVILRHYDHTTVEVRAFTDGATAKDAAGPQDRAHAIAKALIADGVASNRVFAQGYGATRRQVATGKQITSPRDRRVEIRIRPQASG